MEDIYWAICAFLAERGNAQSSEDEIEKIHAEWRRLGAAEGVSVLEYGTAQLEDIEAERSVLAESQAITVEQWCACRIRELDLRSSSRDPRETLGDCLAEIRKLETKTGFKAREIHDMNSLISLLAERQSRDPGDKEVLAALEDSLLEIESAIPRTRHYLRSLLERQQKHRIKLSMNAPVRHTHQRARVASRASRVASRPTFTQEGGGGGSGGDGDPDNGDSDPPAPTAQWALYTSPVTSNSKRKHLNRYCCRVSEGRWAA